MGDDRAGMGFMVPGLGGDCSNTLLENWATFLKPIVSELDLFKNRENWQVNLFPVLQSGILGILLP